MDVGCDRTVQVSGRLVGWVRQYCGLGMSWESSVILGMTRLRVNGLAGRRVKRWSQRHPPSEIVFGLGLAQLSRSSASDLLILSSTLLSSLLSSGRSASLLLSNRGARGRAQWREVGAPVNVPSSLVLRR